MGLDAWLEWERLFVPVEFSPEVFGPLPPSIRKVRVGRRGDLRLEVVAEADHSSGPLELPPDPHEGLRAGEQLPAPAEVRGIDHGQEVQLDGLRIQTHSLVAWATLTVRGFAQSVSVRSPVPADGARFEWLANFALPAGLMHPRGTKREWSSKVTIKRDGLEPLGLNLDGPVAPFQSSQDHFELSVRVNGGLIAARVGEPAMGTPKEILPGFVWWNPRSEAVPDDEPRRWFLAGLSFALGRQLAEMGHTTFSAEWDPAEQRCVVPRLMGSTGSGTLHPAPLHTDEPYLDERLVSRVVEGFVEHAEEFALEHALWLYWVGVNSPLDVRPVHFGGAIEALRDAYFDAKLGADKRLLPKDLWVPIKVALVGAFDGFERRLEEGDQASGGQPDQWKSAMRALPDGRRKLAQRVFRNKLQQLNDKSSGMQWDEFFAQIGVRTGEVEKAALRQRNGPAHGGRYSGDYRWLSASVRALQTLFNRCLLRVTSGADHYIDYSTYGFPVRKIEEPLGGPEGDGVAAPTS